MSACSCRPPLARHLGLRELVDHHLDLGGAPGRANTGDKMLTLVASALAGGDCIDDADALRAGGTVGVLGCVVKERMDLLELAASTFAVRNLSPEVALLRKGGMDGDVDFLQEALRVLVEEIMDAEVSARIGAEYGERSPERVTQRNGYRSRAWDTRVGTMDLHIPKLREGSYFPSLLEPRRRSERALLAVIQQAYVEGVSTRRVDDLVKALGV